MAHIRLVTGEEMARIDERAISEGIPGLQLMEEAGKGVSRVVEGLLGGYRGQKVVIVCGKGNNGGDGFVVGRLAALSGAQVRVFLLANCKDVKGDARSALNRVREGDVETEIVDASSGMKAVRRAVSEADVTVDALLGTGIQGGPRGEFQAAIDTINGITCPVVSVDVPSGLDADTGAVTGSCIRATRTVTFGNPKRGHLFYPGRSAVGQLHLVDIGLPSSAIETESSRTFWIAASGGLDLLPLRSPTAHKGDCGRVFVLSGSVGMTGAAALTATSALRGGAGLVTVGIPESLNDTVEAKVTEAMTLPLPEVRKARCLALRARGDVRRVMEGADCVALGPGLGQHHETAELVRRLLEDIQVPSVLDADALNALSGEPERLRALHAPSVVTPHPGEFCRLTGKDAATVAGDPIGSARELAEIAGVTVVLKGSPTVVATADGEAYLNPSGNAGMATGGSGDVLTGLIAALIGQGLQVPEAACLGVYMHGLAADLVSEEKGEAGMIAGDLVSAIPEAEQAIHSGRDCQRYLQIH